MKTGDADVEFWLESKGGLRFCCIVQSRRPSEDAPPVYHWLVETWGDDEAPLRRSRVHREDTFSEAMRRARRHADYLEGQPRPRPRQR